MNEIETIRFPVAGMTCMSCVNRITRSLRKIDGVSRVKVDLGRETATVSRDRDHVSDAAMTAAVAAAGYEANLDAAFVVPSAERRGFLRRLIRRTP